MGDEVRSWICRCSPNPKLRHCTIGPSATRIQSALLTFEPSPQRWRQQYVLTIWVAEHAYSNAGKCRMAQPKDCSIAPSCAGNSKSTLIGCRAEWRQRQVFIE